MSNKRGSLHFDEGSGSIAHDYSGNGHDGTIYGATWTTDGASGSALYFDGSGDYVTVGDMNTFVYTYNIWVKPDSTITENTGGSGDENSLALTSFSTGWVDNLALGNCTDLLTDETIALAHCVEYAHQRTGVIDQHITNTAWHMTTFVWNSEQNRYDIYFDGELKPVVSSVYGHVQLMPCSNFIINRFNSRYVGKIDEARIYDRALSAEVCQLYNMFGPWDQEKLFFDPAREGYILFYTDGDLDGWHDPGEPYFAGQDPSANDWNWDMSCWMASANNILQHECHGNLYRGWLGDGGAPSPSTSPWGVVINANGGGDHMTFDDGGWQQWALANAGQPFIGPIITNPEFGTWGTDPIAWCQARILADHPVGLTVWWGVLPRGAIPGWIDPEKQFGYHAITLWDIDAVAGTVTITDSDDRVIGSRVLSYTFSQNDWVIQSLYQGVNVHVNYAVSTRSIGDVNADGVINVSDVVYLINYLFISGPAPEPWQAGDVNCDGIINAADVVYLINYLFISGPPPGC